MVKKEVDVPSRIPSRSRLRPRTVSAYGELASNGTASDETSSMVEEEISDELEDIVKV